MKFLNRNPSKRREDGEADQIGPIPPQRLLKAKLGGLHAFELASVRELRNRWQSGGKSAGGNLARLNEQKLFDFKHCPRIWGIAWNEASEPLTFLRPTFPAAKFVCFFVGFSRLWALGYDT